MAETTHNNAPPSPIATHAAEASSSSAAPVSPVSPVTPTPPPAAAQPSHVPAAAPTAAPRAAPAVTFAQPNDVTSADAPRTRRFQFQEHLWAWKAGIRILSTVIAIVGIGCLAWAGADAAKHSSDSYWDNAAVGAFAIPLIFVVIFNAIVLLILFISKKPIHPGVPVGIDLVLWLGLLSTALICLGAAFDAVYYADDISYSQYHSGNDNGYYSGSYYSSDDSDCEENGDCAAYDAYLKATSHRGVIEFVGCATLFICMLLHFVTFVWACVDTHRYNREKTTGRARVLAEKIVQEMVATGQLVRPAPILLRQQDFQAQQPLLAPGQGYTMAGAGDHGAARRTEEV